MATTLLGLLDWSMTRDAEGHRTYKVVHKVIGDVTDGPANAIQTAGLPLPGAYWLFDNDVDIWAWCRPDATVKPMVEGEPNEYWTVEQTFSTKPPDNNQRRCADTTITDPFQEPWKISGGFSNDKEEATFDRFGNAVANSAFEQIRGPQVEFDYAKATVTLEHNSSLLGADIWGPMIDTVNAAPMWGFPARSVKLNTVPWERKYYGTCSVYYSLKFEFEISVKLDSLGALVTRYDRDILNEGTKVLNGRWNAAQGSGCTLDVHATAGAVDSQTTINAGGSGYPKNSTVGLIVSASNNSAVVLVTTNGSGVVTSVSRVHIGGTGYSTTVGVATATSSGWVLNNDDGDVPDYLNPADYIHYVDKKGNPAKVILSARGLPIGGIAGKNESAVKLHLEKYGESDFLSLGIPAAF